MGFGMKKLLWLAALWLGGVVFSRATPLDDYVHAPDTNFAWRVLETTRQDGATVTRVGFISQCWRGTLWTNYIWIVRPPELRHPQYAALIIGGDEGTNLLKEATAAARRAGAWAVALSRIPNQPLYDGRKEDKLIAYTFDQYLKTDDDSWPLLLPMVKSAVRAMDLTQSWLDSQHLPRPEKFVVTGASKRGWTTWLTAAVDARVAAIAPRVFDMLNLKAQTDWAQKVYGRQSEQIQAYVELGLVDRMDTPGMRRLSSFVDPYAYRDRLQMPKLVLLGANDPFWTVDSPRHYWADLPGPKLLFEAPNTGHHLGGDSLRSFAAFFQCLAEGRALPEVTWQMSGTNPPGVTVTFNPAPKEAWLWTAVSTNRDFRPAHWTSRPLPLAAGAREVSATVKTPASGYRAFMVVLTFASPDGDYKLSTPVQVTPDNLR
jgi:PhoPQ-activated pathogenicity-related protein